MFKNIKNIIEKHKKFNTTSISLHPYTSVIKKVEIPFFPFYININFTY